MDEESTRPIEVEDVRTLEDLFDFYEQEMPLSKMIEVMSRENLTEFERGVLAANIELKQMMAHITGRTMNV